MLVDEVRMGGTEACAPFAVELAVLPEGVTEGRLPLNGGIAWITILILLPEAPASLGCGLEDEDVFTIALEEAADG